MTGPQRRDLVDHMRRFYKTTKRWYTDAECFRLAVLSPVLLGFEITKGQAMHVRDELRDPS